MTYGRSAIAILCFTMGSMACTAQTIFSPSQSELLGLTFADFIDNAAPDNAALQGITAIGTDGVRVTFKTDYDINDAVYRVAMQAPISADLTALESFQVTLSNPLVAPAGIPSIRAQLFVRSAGGASFANGGQVLTLGATPITLSVPKSRIIDLGGDPSDITAFGLEFFGGDEFLGGLDGAMATISTTPQPPTLVDHVLFSWENGADLQGWDSPAINNAGHDEVVVQGTVGSPALGATDGLNALKITRHPTGANFSWASAYALDAYANFTPATGDYNSSGGVDAADYTVWRDNLGTNFALPNRAQGNTGNVSQADYATWQSNYGSQASGPDPAVQLKIAELVDALNDPAAYSIAFDVTVPATFDPLPGYAIFHLAIAADGGPANSGNPFFQNNNGLIPGSALGSDQPVTVEMKLSDFLDVSSGSGTQGMSLADVGIYESTGYLTIHLASNIGNGSTPLANDFNFVIDNFRIRSIAPEAVSVPEPVSALLLVLGVFGAVFSRR